MPWDSLNTTKFPLRMQNRINKVIHRENPEPENSILQNQNLSTEIRWAQTQWIQLNWFSNATRLRVFLMWSVSCVSFVYFNHIQFVGYDCIHSFHWHSQTGLGERRSLGRLTTSILGSAMCVCETSHRLSAL